MKFTEEQLKKMNAAKTAEELIALAKAEGIEASEEQIKVQFATMHQEGEIADEELNNVSGGCGGGDDPDEHVFKPGDRVRVTAGECKGRTGTSNGMDYTSRGGEIMAWVTFDDNGKKESVRAAYLERI